MRRFWHRYTAAVLAGFVFVGLIVVIAAGLRDWAVIVSLAALAVSLIYSVQSQRLEETRLFKELFSEFNFRYDKLNAKLESAVHCRSEECLTKVMRENLVDYFNLCAEEYMFYKLGYIREEAWQAWLEGMRYYYDNDHIRKLWDKELEQDSYYGFTAAHLHRKPTAEHHE